MMVLIPQSDFSTHSFKRKKYSKYRNDFRQFHQFHLPYGGFFGVNTLSGGILLSPQASKITELLLIHLVFSIASTGIKSSWKTLKRTNFQKYKSVILVESLVFYIYWTIGRRKY